MDMTKPTENELFEQWFWNDNSDDYNKPEYEMGLRAWTAHAELADKEKAELRQVAANQSMQLAHYKLTCESYEKKFFQMQVQINEFRYLLELCQNGLRWYQDTHPEDASPEDDELHIAINYRLNKTPEQCLIENHNEVIDKILNLYSPDDTADDYMDKIRALKG